MRDFLGRHECVAADSMVFIYHLQAHDRYSPATSALLRSWDRGEVRDVTSVITPLEVLVRPKRLGLREVERDYRRLLFACPNLRVVSVTEAIAGLAAELRARHDLPTPDAIRLATALDARATGFVTNDRRLATTRGIEVLVLDDVT
jgi:predicted nucleic acid-binding protein